MRYYTLLLNLPLILTLHSAEEYAGFDRFTPAYPRYLAGITKRDVRDAAILLTLAAAALPVLEHRSRSPALRFTMQAAVFALGINGLGHCVLSLRLRMLVPGTFSALTLIFPYTALAIASMRTELRTPWLSLVRRALLGALANPLLIVLSLRISRSLRKLTAPRRSRRALLA